MKILAVGGGSGGHVTPVVAVLRELRSLHPRADIQFWSDRTFGPQATAIMGTFDHRIKVSYIFAGKFRRYNNLSLWRQLARPFSIVLPNLRDLVLAGMGVFQSLLKLLIWRPDVVFTKGGYVCLPVGLAARILGIHIVIHDSDAHPGLTNRVLARWASAIATGAPLEYYSYPQAITRYVGIPVAPEFKPLNSTQQIAAKQMLGFEKHRPLVVVTGGGLGAQRINMATAEILDDLLKDYSVLLLCGAGQYDALRALTPQDNARFRLIAFVTDGMADILGAADVVVTRAGATTLLELAASAKPIVLVPNGYLTGGHQLKNAAVYADQGAAIIVSDDEIVDHPQRLYEAIHRILSDDALAKSLSSSLAMFAKPNAAQDVAHMILSAVK